MVLVYVKHICDNTDGTHEYDFFFSNTPEFVWGPFWDVDSPASNGDISPDKTTYNETKRVVTTLPLKTVEETSCHSMEYATYGILALSWIDIENLDTYPEHGRMVLRFGDNEEYVAQMLEEYDWHFQNKNSNSKQ